MQLGDKLFRVILYLFILASIAWGECSDTWADPVIDLTEVSLAYGRYLPGGRTSLFDNPKEQLNLEVDWALWRYIFMRNTVHAWTDEFNFKQIGWEYQVGVKYGSVEAGLYHFSQHLLDAIPARNPQETAVYLKVYLYQK